MDVKCGDAMHAEADFQTQYQQLTDDELFAIAADTTSLLPEAAAALTSEIRQRGVEPPKPPRWVRDLDSAEPVESLQDYEEYRRVCKRQKLVGRYWYLVAIGPFVLGLFGGGKWFENSVLPIGLALVWAMLVVIYNLWLLLRVATFKCPQCMHRFGTRDECSSCSFPRNPYTRETNQLA